MSQTNRLLPGVIGLLAVVVAVLPDGVVVAQLNTLQRTLLLLTGLGLAPQLGPYKMRQASLVYLRYLFLVLAATLVLMPFAWLVAAAFKKPEALMEHTFLPPVGQWRELLGAQNYRDLFAGEETSQGRVYFWRYLLNSLFLASTGTCLHIFCASLTGFAIAKYEFRGKALITGLMLGSMMIPGMILLAPLYELIYRFGWMDTYWALLIPGAVPVFGVFLFRQAIVGVPDELLEAARVDGCGEFGIYWNLVMPLVRPMIGAFCLVSFLGSWNSFLGPQIFIQSQAKLTLPVVLNQYIGLYAQKYGVFLAGTLLSIIPPAVMFFSLQKEFVSGLTSGAVKG